MYTISRSIWLVFCPYLHGNRRGGFFMARIKAQKKVRTVPRPALKEKMAELRSDQLEGLWPRVDAAKDIWEGTAKKPGFRTVPRTMPLILRIMDKAADERVSGAYFDLWMCAYDEFIVSVKDEDDRAFFSGYGYPRTWRSRIKKLKDLGFIDTANYARREYGHILIYNPHKVITWLHDTQPELIDGALYDTLAARCVEFGVTDFTHGWDHPRDRKLRDLDDVTD